MGRRLLRLEARRGVVVSRRLVTVKQVAEAVGVSVMTVHRMIDRDELRVVRVGKQTVRIDVTSLDPVVQEVLAENQS